MRAPPALGFPLALAALTFAACSPAASDYSSRTSNIDSAKSGLLGINIDPQNGDAYPAAADVTALGATRVRVELKVDHGDVQGALAFYDQVLARYASQNIAVLFILDYSTVEGFAAPVDAQGNLQSNDQSDFDSYRQKFAARAGAIASHYSQRAERGAIAGFEIWNEEDLCGGADYCPFIHESNYAALLADAAEAVHASFPGATVVLGGLGAGQPAYLQNVYSAIGVRWQSVDAIGLHPYVKWPATHSENGYSSMTDFIAQNDAAAGGSRPFWLTEWGTDDPSLEAQMVTDFFSLFGSGDYHVQQAYFFCWSDGQKPGFGVFDTSGNQKPAWQAFHDGATAPATVTTTSRLHGTVRDASGNPIGNIQVSAWGVTNGDYHVTKTGPDGIYQFTDLNPDSDYNLVVNGDFDSGNYDPVNAAYGVGVRNNVVLVSGDDGWHGEEFSIAGGDGAPAPPPSTGPTTTAKLHGTVQANLQPQAGLQVSAWGKSNGDFHVTQTDSSGIYQFTDLNPASQYNIVVNANYVNGAFVIIDNRFGDAIRNDVQLIAGPDGWHGEDFALDAGSAPPPPTANTPKLHGTVSVNGQGIAGIQVTAWDKATGELHVTQTDSLGIYQFTDLAPDDSYNLVVNGDYQAGQYVPVDASHAVAVRNDVQLASGPDGWHGEDFPLAY